MSNGMKAVAGAETLAEILDGLTVEGRLYDRLPGEKVRCYACGHRCVIFNGQRGICQVRFNKNGVLYVPYGYVGALQCDPIEKKPFFHVLPGSRALTFGMLGCDFHCSYCQNWLTSQALRDPAAGVSPMEVTPEQMLELAKRFQANLVVSSYNEPLITSEWAVGIFQLAKQSGLRTGYVSNGNVTGEVLDYLLRYTDCYKIDLKTMNDRNYRKLGGVLQHVLDAVKLVYEKGFWLEVVTLVIPGFNDSDEELREAARYIAGVSTDIPWHVTAFHKDYKMTDPDNTPPKTLLRAAEIGREEGLHFVYAGNLPGWVKSLENTYCPTCHTLLVQRYGYTIEKDLLSGSGSCPRCQTKIPGIWQ